MKKYSVTSPSSKEYEIELYENADGSFDVSCEGEKIHCDLREIRHGHLYSILLNRRCHDVTVFRKEEGVELSIDGREFQFQVLDEMAKVLQKAGGQRAKKKGPPVIKAQMPGVVIDVLVKEGQRVVKGDILLLMEAMKMQNEILAPADALIKKVEITKGQLLKDGQKMIYMDYDEKSNHSS